MYQIEKQINKTLQINDNIVTNFEDNNDVDNISDNYSRTCVGIDITTKNTNVDSIVTDQNISINNISNISNNTITANEYSSNNTSITNNNNSTTTNENASNHNNISSKERCQCGCVPNIMSLFEMAALRAKYKQQQQSLQHINDNGAINSNTTNINSNNSNV